MAPVEEEFVGGRNELASQQGLRLQELAPLPASAQFLKVIESVFSGMAHSVIDCSDCESKEATQAAMDRYFNEQNAHFLARPRRVGKKIRGTERVAAELCASNSCKDPEFRRRQYPSG